MSWPHASLNLNDSELFYKNVSFDQQIPPILSKTEHAT